MVLNIRGGGGRTHIMIVTGETESTKEQEQAKNQGTVRHTLKAMDRKLGLDEVGKNKHSWDSKR